MDGFTASLKTCSQMAAEYWRQTKKRNVLYWHKSFCKTLFARITVNV